MGAWIEIHRAAHNVERMKSHPTWVRGLKSVNYLDDVAASSVAPHVGAWIEIFWSNAFA